MMLRWVSTHASARDATSLSSSMPYDSRFQLTRPRGTRLRRCFALTAGLRFQLTRPRGTRLRRSCSVLAASVFQLTRPRGTRQGQ